ncbi:MAG: hypothetical protein WBD00_07150 [Candidatus Omnitrophota bacterium]
MRLCSGEEASAFIKKLTSEKHQVKPQTLDLTVANVFILKEAGYIDFGGSEEKEAIVEPLEPLKRSDEDKYGWWSLTEGEYFVEFNEKGMIPENHIGFIRPLSRTLRAGGFHPALVCLSGEKIDRALFSVGKIGFNVKENARISSFMLIELGSGE